ncbi:MAG: DNA polymerase III subunit gamma/tau [Dysgonamonadaceae bacterium]|nr:DNA polymerase III subunit gamma/tau [Dysgonamonadaceae bacterium]
MDNYIVSARKYRPVTFNSVIGQKALTTTLKNAILNRKLAHAYLFCGPRGVGKTTCARIFAKTINCFHPTADGEACNECESCLSFNENRSLNIHELDAASNNSVDDIRSLNEQVRIPPQLGQYKVYIIDEVHMLSSAAFNAFLKTLEEPPHHAIFILATTEKHKILPTILSRCQIYDFNRISINDIVEYLEYVASNENVNAEKEALNVIAQKADGGMRDALSIFDQVASFSQGNVTYKTVIENLNVLDYDYYFRLTEAFLSRRVSDSMLILNDILSKGFDGQHIVSGLGLFLRDLLVCKDAQTIVLFETGDAVREKYRELASRCDVRFLYKAMEITNETDLSYQYSKNKRFAIELMLIRLCQLTESPSDEDKKKTKLAPIVETPKIEETKNEEAKPEVKDVINKPVTETIETKKITNLGLKSLNNKEESKDEKNGSTQQETEETVMNEPFTLDQLNSAWKSLADTTKDNHLRSVLIFNQPQIADNGIIEIGVASADQANLLASHSAMIKEFLSANLKNNLFEISVKVTDKPTLPSEDTLLDDKERYLYMAKKNPSLTALVKEFKLRL